MKTFRLIVIIAATFCLLLTTGVFGEEKAPLKKAAGEVMAIDEGGKAIVST